MLRGLLPPVFLFILASAVLPYMLALQPAEEAFDRALGDGAYAIATMIFSTPPDKVVVDRQAEGAIRTDSLDQILFSVSGPNGVLLAGDSALTTAVRPPLAPNPWIHTDTSGAEPLRMFSLVAPCGGARCDIRIAETLHKRDALRRAALLSALVPELLLSVFMVLFVYFGVRRALAPLQSYTSNLLQVEESGWRMLDPGEAVQEVRPLILALNRAASRLRSAADSQQRFLSTAAHQLRTPLAGLKGAADLARLSHNPDQVKYLLGQLSHSADRVARLASQLLALARSEPHVQNPEQRRACDLAELAQDLIEEAVRQAAASDIDIGFELTAAPLQGHPLLLRELIANLVDNAIRYTPAGGSVTVRTGCGASPQPAFVGRGELAALEGADAPRESGGHSMPLAAGGPWTTPESGEIPPMPAAAATVPLPAVAPRGLCWVEVVDDGPGIPAHLRDMVLGRFVRLPGTTGEGSGLGLAIVKEICESHAATLTMSDALLCQPCPAEDGRVASLLGLRGQRPGLRIRVEFS